MSLFECSKNIVYSSNKLKLTMILLKDWSLIYVEGVDSKNYLQNQLTIDMNTLKRNQHILCAHCNLNGKVWSTMRLFYYKQGYAYIERKSVSNVHVKELKKYSVFSKVIIKRLDNIFLLGLAGLDAKRFLLECFTKIPNKNCPVIHDNKNTILWFSDPSERFLLILSLNSFLIVKEKINIQKNKIIFFNQSNQWLLLDIESGFPIIDKKSSKKFTPQSLNLDKLKAISFNKGCYYGQEIIARIFFKNLNRRSLYVLIGNGNIFPDIGSLIEIQMNNKWYKIGILLSFVNVNNQEIWLQVVLDKDIQKDSLFRVNGFKNIFLIRN